VTTPTHGAYLDAEARRLARRRRLAPTWLPLLEPVAKRSVDFAAARAGFYSRVELDPATADVVDSEDAVELEELALPEAVRFRLREVVGREAEVLRPHVGPASEEVARRQEADAVAVGPEVYFARGRFSPEDVDGLALLVHEATHVAEFQRPGSDWRRETSVQRREEESLARGRELAVRAGKPTPPEPIPSRAPPSPPDAVQPPAAPSTPPAMAAAVDRPLEQAQPNGGSVVDAEELRRAIYRDLMLDVKTDYERGG
jgi:Domain of unknown function (DUF4157)